MSSISCHGNEKHKIVGVEPMRIYAYPLCSPCRSVLMLCDEGHIPMERIFVDIMVGEQHSASFLRINPHGKVPAMDDNGFVLAESGSIMAYICNSRHLESWYPTDPRVRARVDYWLHWNHNNTRLATTKYFSPRLFHEEIDPDGRIAFEFAIGFLDVHFSHHMFLVEKSTAPTIADLMLLPELDQLMWISGLFDCSRFPNIQRYIETMQESVCSYEKYANLAKESIRSILQNHH